MTINCQPVGTPARPHGGRGTSPLADRLRCRAFITPDYSSTAALMRHKNAGPTHLARPTARVHHETGHDTHEGRRCDAAGRRPGRRPAGADGRAVAAGEIAGRGA